MSLKFNVAFWGIVAAQLVLLLAMVGFKEYTLRTGTVVTLQTVPVDPRSILQGDYAILQYRIATLPPHMQDLPQGATVYVTLQEQGEVWEAVDYSLSPPSGGRVFIKGTVDDRGLLDFRIGTYFVPEGTGHIIERATDVKVRASVDTRGRAVITEVLVDGDPFDPSLEPPPEGRVPPERPPEPAPQR
jgi:uncharacterized membrane-anchored protein